MGFGLQNLKHPFARSGDGPMIKPRSSRRKANANGWIRRRGKLITRSLEINVTAHCNLKCYGCGRGSPALSEEYLSAADLAGDLEVLTKVLHVREFKLAGGEPLQHPELREMIDGVRQSGIADKITLITNGVLLQARDELWKKIDKIWVSVYPGVKRKLSEAEILSLGRKHGVEVRYRATDTFMRRMLNAENRDAALVRAIYADCYERASCHSIYKGRYYKCASGPFVPKWLERIGSDTPDFSTDGVPLHTTPDLRQALEEYLRSEEPLAACRYCLGGAGKSFPNRQMNDEGLRDWLTEDHSDVHALIDPARLAPAQPPARSAPGVWQKVTGGLFGGSNK
jgi:organic radical activating enzyme